MARSPHSRHLNELVKKDPKFKALVAKHGMPRGPKDCTEMNPGDICMVSNCVDGKRIEMRCDGSGGCTDYKVVPC
jgi:hypothetical protein